MDRYPVPMRWVRQDRALGRGFLVQVVPYDQDLQALKFKGIDFRSKIIKEIKIFAALIFCVNYINLKFLQK